MKTAVRKIFLCLVVAGMLLSAPMALAQEAAYPPVLKKFADEGNTIGFLGQAYGLDGWLITDPKGDQQYAYTTPDGALITGRLFAPDGTPETEKQVLVYQQQELSPSAPVKEEAAPKEEIAAPPAPVPAAQPAPAAAAKPLSKAEKLYTETEGSGWVSIGDSGAPYIYIFMNVACDHCQGFLKDLDSSVKDGRLQLRLVPYGSQEVNRDGGAALLSVEHPAEALRAYLGGDKAALGKDKIKDGAYDRLDANTALAQEWKVPGPPFTLYRRPSDDVVTAIIGRPDNALLLPAEFLK